MSMKWMGCLNHDLPYSIDNPSEKPRERRATQNWRAPTEKREEVKREREKNRWCFTNHSLPMRNANTNEIITMFLSRWLLESPNGGIDRLLAPIVGADVD